MSENKHKIAEMMDIKLLEKYNRPGPRYTSYPPATFFHDGYGKDHYIKNITASNGQKPESISLYLHVPFCPRLCHFCGCNTSISKSQDFVSRYINAIMKEIETVSRHLDRKRVVTQIHWGGGTPNSISMDHIERVMRLIQDLFTLAPGAEIAMECSPAYLEFQDISRLREMGFNRLSLGVQDFNEEVLKNVNRQPSKHPVGELVKTIQDAGYEGVNIDLIYGLPGQTPASFEQSVRQAMEISPDRIVTFSYAHVPWVKGAQKHLEKIGLPAPQEKLEMFGTAYRLLTQSGYISVGMDHYAKPGDDLSKALDDKMLHRNFQGYCTKQTTGQVYGFGSSSISQMWGAYAQNIKEVKRYMEAVEANGLATDRGYELTDENLICRSVINELMCNGHLDFQAIAREFDATAEQVKQMVGYGEHKLKEFVADDLLSLGEDTIQLKPEGFFVVRNIAMEFDPLLNVGEAQYSKTV